VEKARNDIGAKIVAMDAIIAQCEARFGRRVQVLDHPILGPLTAPQWRKLHLVHGRHHQKQVPSGKRAEVNGRARARVRFFPYSIIPLAQLFTAIYIQHRYRFHAIVGSNIRAGKVILGPTREISSRRSSVNTGRILDEHGGPTRGQRITFLLVGSGPCSRR
jgi:hypothetical protein